MKKILVADDEDVLRMLIVDSLEDLSFEIHEASDGREALSFINRYDFDLVILDYMMPEMTGVEVIKSLQHGSVKKRPKILMLTAKSQQHDQDEIFAIGADYFLAKPFSPLVLIEKVEEILSENLFE